MDCTAQVDRAHKLVDGEEYEKALSHIKRIRAWGCSDQVLVLFEAVCIYEQGDDLRALELLVEFLKTGGSHPKANYAKFTAAICLINLGLLAPAEHILQSLPDGYPDVRRERSEVGEQLRKQQEAMKKLSEITLIGNRENA